MNSTHIILVSDQSAPSFLPALDSKLKASRALLVVTPEMAAKKRDKTLESILRLNGIKVLRHELSETHDYRVIENGLCDMAAAFEHEIAVGEVYLNLTGGTKLMALAAQSVARVHFPEKWRTFYVDLQSNKLVWIEGSAWPAGITPEPQVLDNAIRIPLYLQGYGFELLSGPPPSPWQVSLDHLVQKLLTDVEQIYRPVSRLNAIAQHSEDSRQLRVDFSNFTFTRKDCEPVIQLFADVGLLSFDDQAVVFKSTADRSFVKGGWLERYTYQVVVALQGSLGIRDKGFRVTVREITSDVLNEIDVCFLYRNRLYVIECKTARMDGGDRANDTLYKLVNIHSRVGGLGARGMLLSYRQILDSERKLADALGVRIVHGNDLAHLKREISQWVEGK